MDSSTTTFNFAEHSVSGETDEDSSDEQENLKRFVYQTTSLPTAFGLFKEPPPPPSSSAWKSSGGERKSTRISSIEKRLFRDDDDSTTSETTIPRVSENGNHRIDISPPPSRIFVENDGRQNRSITKGRGIMINHESCRRTDDLSISPPHPPGIITTTTNTNRTMNIGVLIGKGRGMLSKDRHFPPGDHHHRPEELAKNINYPTTGIIDYSGDCDFSDILPPPKYRYFGVDQEQIADSATSSSSRSAPEITEIIQPPDKYRDDVIAAVMEESNRSIITDHRRIIDAGKRYWDLRKEKFDGNTFIDTHCHLDVLFSRQGNFGGTFDEYKRKCQDSWSAAYEGCIADFCYPVTFLYAKKLWTSLLPQRDVHLAFGCHPHAADSYNDDVEKLLQELAPTDKVVAIGEMGLDYSRNNKQDHEVQKKVFKAQLTLATKYQKPLLIHCRDAESDCFQIMKEVVPHDFPIHRHCFTGPLSSAAVWTNQFTNLKIGLTTGIYAPRSCQFGLLKEFPLDRLLIETDAPYFLPRFCRQTEYGISMDVNHPGMGYVVAAKLAEERNLDIAEVLRVIRDNTKQLYRV